MASGIQKEAFTINHTVSINYLSWPKAPGYQAGASAGSRVILQEPAKDKSFLWSVQRLGTPSLQGHASTVQTGKEVESRYFPHLLSHPEGPSLLSVPSPARCEPLTSQRRCRHVIFSFESLSIVLIFRFDSPSFFRNSRLIKCFAPPVPLSGICVKSR